MANPTYWDALELRDAKTDSFEQQAEERVLRFEQQYAPKPAPAAPPAPEPFTFGDRRSLMPWLDDATSALGQGVQQAASTAQSGLASLFDRDALMPWNPKPQPVSAAIPQPELSPGGTPITSPGQMAAPAPSLPAAPVPRTPSMPAAPPPEATGDIDNSSRQAFIRTAWPYMLQAAGGNRDAAEMMLAAAISENGSIGSGRPFFGNAFFGIKGCYDAATEVLTTEGWRPWPVVDAQNVFATLNPESGAIEYQRATHLIRYRHAGEMYRVESDQVDLLVTPDHRMWVRLAPGAPYQIVQARDLSERCVDYLTLHEVPGLRGRARGRRKPVAPLRDHVRDVRRLRALKEMVGAHAWWIVAGMADLLIGRQRHVMGKLVGYAVRPQDKVARREPDQTVALQVNGRRPEPTGAELRSNDGTVLVDLGPEARLDGLRSWPTLAGGRDGTVRVHRDLPPDVTPRPSSPRRGALRRRNYTASGSWVPFDGMVYCATVPNGLLIVRRNGKAVVSGNSGTAGSVESPTWEQTPNGPVHITDKFAAYNTPVEGFRAFFDFLENNSRYAGALARYRQTGDASQLFRDVNAAGYATDPQWASKVENIRANQVAPLTRGAGAPVAQAAGVPVPPAGTPSPPPAGASSSPAGGASPDPLDVARASYGDAGDAMLKADDEYDPRDADSGPREGGRAPFVPSDPTIADSAYTEPVSSSPDIPGPDLSPNGTPIVDQPPSFGPWPSEAGTGDDNAGVAGLTPGQTLTPHYRPEAPAAPAAPTAVDDALAAAIAPARNVYGPAIAEVNERHDAIARVSDERLSEFARAAAVPIETVNRALAIVNAVLMATPQATADTLDAALSPVGLNRDNFGIDVPVLARFGIADIVDLGPLTNIGVARGTARLPATATQFGTGLAGAIERGAGAAVQAGREAVEQGVEAVGRGARALAEEGAGQLLDLTPMPRAVPSSGGVPDDGARRLAREQAEPAPIFYSQLRRVLEEKMPNRAAPGQVLGIVKSGQVKPDEVAWTGLEDWLRQQKGAVTKQQVLEFLDQNAVRVEEAVKRDDVLTWRSRPDGSFEAVETNLQIEPAEGGAWRLVHNGRPSRAEFFSPEEAKQAARDIAADDRILGTRGAGGTRYNQYTLPGGENYRELLLTLPSKTDGPDYQSSHWTEPNVLAHVRFNDRVSADGKRTLLIEEVQSDWHQAGRKQGYRGDFRPTPAQQEIAEIKAQYVGRALDDPTPLTYAQEIELPPPVRQRYSELRAIIGRDPENIRSPIPDAPFKKTWPELAIKRMIRWAAENGYERIAWPPGQVHAERYSLAQHVDDLRYVTKDGATGTLVGYKGGREIVTREGVPADKLSDYIGQDAARKLYEYEPTLTAAGDEYRITGRDIAEVGGEGMRGFYDQILPAVAQKLGKKFGASVGTSQVATTGKKSQTVHSLDITPQMRQSVVTEGQPLFSALPFDPASAAAGGAAGAMSGDEDGEADPLRTATGLLLGGVVRGRGANNPAVRKIVDNVIRQEQALARRLARAAAAKPNAVQPGQVALPAEPIGRASRIAQVVREAVEPWERRLDIIRYAGVLSDTAAHTVNASGGALMQVVDVATGPIAATLDAARVGVARSVGGPIGRRLGTEREVFFSETPARLAGMRAGWSIGLENAREVLRTGLRPEDAAKQLDRESAGFASGNARVDFAFEASLRALAAADAVFRTTAQGGHLAAEGMAAAIRANPGQTITPDLLRDAMKNPDLIEQAGKLAARTVLQEDRKVTTWWRQQVLGKAPPGVRTALSLEFMFTKTPYNIVAQGVGLTPAGLLGVVQDMAQGKSAREIEFRVARAALGTALMGAAWADYTSGNLIGPRPTNEKDASTWPPGQVPWSRKVVVGEQTYYIPLAMLGPLALPPVAAILLGESAKQGGDLTAKAGRMALGLGQYAAQNTFFEGVTTLGRLFDGRSDVSANLERHAEQIAAQFAPHILGSGALGRQIQQILGMPQRDPHGAIEALLATHPATAGMVAPAQDVLGRPRVPNVGGPLRAVARVGKDNDAGVIRAFRQAKEGLPIAPPKQIKDPSTDTMRTLKPSQRARWQRVFGAALREGWNNAGNPTDAAELRSIEAEARTAANETILGMR